MIVLHLFQFLKMFNSFFKLFLPITINFQIDFVFFHLGSKSFLQKLKIGMINGQSSLLGRTFKNWYSISEGWSGGSKWSSLSSRVEQDLSFFLIFLDISFKSGVPPQYKSFYQQSFFCSSVRDSKISDNSFTGDSIRSMILKLSVLTFKSLI